MIVTGDLKPPRPPPSLTPKDPYYPLDLSRPVFVTLVAVTLIGYGVLAGLSARGIIACDYLPCAPLFKAFPPARKHADNLIRHGGFDVAEVENGMALVAAVNVLMGLFFGLSLLYGIFKLVRYGEDRARFAYQFLRVGVICFTVGLFPLFMLHKEKIFKGGNRLFTLTYNEPVLLMIIRSACFITASYLFISWGSMSIARFINHKLQSN